MWIKKEKFNLGVAILEKLKLDKAPKKNCILGHQ